MMEPILFYIWGGMTIGGALVVVLSRHPIASAAALILSFFGMAALFVMLEAHFVAVMQVLLYAGAIMVLFVFVIMLLNLRESDVRLRALTGRRLVPGLAAIYFGSLVIVLLANGMRHVPAESAAINPVIGGIGPVGVLLLSTYAVPFEATSLILLTAVIGAVYLGRRS